MSCVSGVVNGMSLDVARGQCAVSSKVLSNALVFVSDFSDGLMEIIQVDLGRKADKVVVDQALLFKANQSDLLLKESTTNVDAKLLLKADQSAVTTSLALKADKTVTDGLTSSLALKADATVTDGLTSSLAAKADKTVTDGLTTSLALKADATSLALKADKTVTDGLTTSLALKADQSAVTSSLALKADLSDLSNREWVMMRRSYSDPNAVVPSLQIIPWISFETSVGSTSTLTLGKSTSLGQGTWRVSLDIRGTDMNPGRWNLGISSVGQIPLNGVTFVTLTAANPDVVVLDASGATFTMTSGYVLFERITRS